MAKLAFACLLFSFPVTWSPETEQANVLGAWGHRGAKLQTPACLLLETTRDKKYSYSNAYCTFAMLLVPQLAW